MNFAGVMNDSNSPKPENNSAIVDEGNDPKSGENDSSKAITGAVEAGWNGSVAGTNDALEPDSPGDAK